MTEPTGRQVQIPAQGWRPRGYQMPVWRDLERAVPNVLAITHRRWGKDELMLNDCAVNAAKHASNLFYFLPETEHVRKAIWTSINPHTSRRRIDEAFPDGFRVKILEDEMIVRVRSQRDRSRVAMNEPAAVQHYHSAVHFTGSDNYDAIRGASGRVYYFSEWAWADPQALAILRPIVEENHGYMRFITTACGKNHAFKMLQNEGKPGWGVHLIPNSRTGVFTSQQLAAILEENIDLYGPEVGRALFEQEYECSFEEIVPGSFYLDLLLKAEREGRLLNLAPRPDLPVHAFFDLGFTDPTAIWYAQMKEDGWLDIVGYDEFTRTSIPEMIPALRAHPWYYGGLYLPHDGPHHEVTSGTTTEQLLTAAGFRVTVMPQTDDGAQIQSVRMLLPRCRFSTIPTVSRGLECLRHFHNKSKTDKGRTSWAPKPVHDWSSHGAKAFATLAYFAPDLRAGVAAPVRPVHDALSMASSGDGGWMR